MEIQLNGEPYSITPGQTLAGLVSELGLEPRGVAIEVNLEVVPRSEYAECRLKEGDQVEIVRAIGGGLRL